MEWLSQLLSNRILICSLSAWAAAQIIKTILYAIINKTLSFERLFGDGGMPSGHSATVTSMAISCGMVYGFDTGIFAIAAIVAIVVMHDATGVRLETGKQAKIINELLEHLRDREISDEEKLKELVGHTPLQVLCGALLGAVMAVIINLI
ncbi:MAG: divergent PAP2 family protein [Oscillospiraceae bacterium]|nr:divergent PAP2 family protein [Oscillospiraceae bacterium]